MTRRQSRELAFVLLFEKTFTEDSFEEIIEKASESRDITVDSYAKNTCVNTQLNKDAIDETITKYLRKWTLNRISRVSASVLRLAMYEIIFVDEIPFKVSINEAVEIAKKYAGVEEAAFVNGVLGSYIRDTQSNAEAILKDVVSNEEIKSEDQPKDEGSVEDAK